MCFVLDIIEKRREEVSNELKHIEERMKKNFETKSNEKDEQKVDDDNNIEMETTEPVVEDNLLETNQNETTNDVNNTSEEIQNDNNEIVQDVASPSTKTQSENDANNV